MLRLRLTSIRGQLLLWYLAVLVLLLVGLGVVQWLTITSYLRSATENGMRHGAYRELSVLGTCYVRSSQDLAVRAQTLARLLGGYDTADMIVTPSAVTLASHSMGQPGAAHPVHLSLSTIQTVIGSPGLTGGLSGAVAAKACSISGPTATPGPPGGNGSNGTHSTVTGNNLLVVAVPLGPPDHTLGYAILARSLQGAEDTAKRVVAVFAIGAAVMLLLTALIALPIINRALRPLHRVVSTAEAIAAGDLEERANLTRSRDEVGRLGEAFDTMVDQLQNAMSGIAASEERMRRFLADASHELRTPVTVLRGSSQVLLRHAEPFPPEITTALSDMHDEAVRLTRLVDDLLTLSRLDAGQVPAAESVELGPFLLDFLERYRSVWPDRSIELNPDIDGLAASVNRDALQRIITNLVDNAARYSRAGGAIRVGGISNGRDVRVSVADEGPGLDPEEAKHLFDRFYRAYSSRSRSSGGSGLGLSIVQGLVEQSGGSIAIDTAPDRGTTVTVTLPKAG